MDSSSAQDRSRTDATNDASLTGASSWSHPVDDLGYDLEVADHEDVANGFGNKCIAMPPISSPDNGSRRTSMAWHGSTSPDGSLPECQYC